MSNNTSVNIVEILKEATGEAREWVAELEKIQINYARYSWIFKVDNFLKHLLPDQTKFIKEKFNGVNNTYQLFDKLVEILVAIEYRNEQPQFLSEDAPDIFLEKTQQYIEVKNFNLSDEYKAQLEELQKYRQMSSECNATLDELHKEDWKRYDKILKYVKEKINEGIDQLAKRKVKGFVYFVYDIDSSDFSLETVPEISSRLEKDIEKYSLQQKIKVECKQFSQLLK